MKMHRVTAVILATAISSGGKKHRGADVVCDDGAAVNAPFMGMVNKKARPYGNSNAINNGVLLSGAGFCIKMFYTKPLKYSGLVKKGEKIGIMLTMQSLYQGIISHVHVQNCDLTDPASNL